MLNDILTKNEKKALVNRKYHQAFLGFAELVNAIHKKKHHSYAKSLKDAGFSLKECKDFGFEFGKILWSNCDNNSPRCLGLTILLCLARI